MEFATVIERRRTCRDFSEEKVPYEVIQRALNAGLKAPSYNHQKEWEFVLVTEDSVKLSLVQAGNMSASISAQVKQALDSYEYLAREMYLEAISKQNKMILTAAAVLVIVYKPKTPVGDSQKVVDLNCLAAAWCCIENILLSFAESNVFGVTLVPDDTTAIKQALSIPQAFEVAAIIPFGYKADNAKTFPQKEVKLETVLHMNRW